MSPRRAPAGPGPLRPTRNEPDAPVVGEVRPGPLDQDQETIAEADQEHQVDGEPRHPGDRAPKPKTADLRDGSVAADGRHHPLVPVPEGARRLAPSRPPDVR